MENRIRWLRIGYWLGIVMDAIAFICMLFPSFFLRVVSVNIAVDTGLSWALRFGAPLMAGWTVLLYWADRKPVERKDVLLITLCPVVLGITSFWLYTIAMGLASFGQMLPILLQQAVLIAVFGYRYYQARGCLCCPRL
jgi:hypothetical protein